jgi:hypothetical protein
MVLPPSAGAYGGAGPFEMGLTWALTIVATAIVGARAWVGFKMFDRNPGWDVMWATTTYVSPTHHCTACPEISFSCCFTGRVLIGTNHADCCCGIWHR